MNDSEEKLRQEAILLYLQNISVSIISSQLLRSRQWVHKWILKYKNKPGSDWYIAESRAPKKILHATSIDVEKSIVEVRKILSSKQYSQKGAVSILYELKRIGITAPSVSTINRILKKHNLEGGRKRKFTKTKEYPVHYYDVQQMDFADIRFILWQ